jgi:hypothetical protein
MKMYLPKQWPQVELLLPPAAHVLGEQEVRPRPAAHCGEGVGATVATGLLNLTLVGASLPARRFSIFAAAAQHSARSGESD